MAIFLTEDGRGIFQLRKSRVGKCKRDKPGDNGAAMVLLFVCLLHETILINFAF